ncbi:MAG: hypothetical protein Q8Q04_02820 [archaeon]|nr:hypothetical protein [archaeon]
MILIISLCKEKLHELEFVKPIEKIVGKNYFVKNYKEVGKADLEKAEKVIIPGTSLKDFEYLDNLDQFSWIKDFSKPVLGICAGSQIIHLIFSGKLVNDVEMGFVNSTFGNFLGIKKGEHKVYALHNKSAYSDEFDVYAESNPLHSYHATKHCKKEIYGVLFHSEVLNPELIENFVNL